MFPAPLVLIREAMDVILGRLESLPPSDATDQLQARLRDCVQEAEMWSAAWATQRELDALVNRVLGLWVEVTKLERGSVHASAAAGPYA